MEDAFFVRYLPGLNALSQEERKRTIAAFLRRRPDIPGVRDRVRAAAERMQEYFGSESGAYRFQGSGHLEDAKLFSERFLALVGVSGSIGVVLPRQALVLAGWAELRREFSRNALTHVSQWRNKGGWLFQDAEHRYVAALLALNKGVGDGDAEVCIAAGAYSPHTLAIAERTPPVMWKRSILAQLVSEDLQIPLLTAPGQEQLLARLLGHPRVGSPQDAGRFFGIPYSVLDVGRDLVELRSATGRGRVLRTRNVEQFFAAPDDGCHRVSLSALTRFLKGKLRGAEFAPLLDAAAFEAPLATINLGYRYPARNDDSRTVIAAVLPKDCSPAVGYVHSVVLPLGGATERFALLGFLNSLTWDWFARRFVDRHVTASIIRMLPLPAKRTNWNIGRIAELAREVHTLRDSGTSEEAADVVDRRAALDAEVARALRLSADDLEIIFEDFSDGALGETYRRMVIEALGAQALP